MVYSPEPVAAPGKTAAAATKTKPESVASSGDRAIRDHCARRLASLRKVRDGWLPHWKELSDFLLPRRGRFLGDGRKGAEKNGRINDSTGPKSLRTFRSGMMSNATSPARPWFRLGIEDGDLAGDAAVQLWLDEVRRRMLAVFQRSNIYTAYHQGYEEIGAYGTGVIVLETDFDTVIRATTLTAGEYMLAENARGEVDTLYREVQLTVAKLVDRWGLEAVSERVREAWAAKRYDDEICVVHAIEPNPEVVEGKAGPGGKRYRSVYYDPADTSGRVLSIGGFARFPALCARWDLSSGEVYGRSPGMEALPDLRQLTQMEKRLAMALDKIVNPPLQGPPELANRAVSSLPGGITFLSSTEPGRGLRTIYDVPPQVQMFMGKMEEVRARVKETFFVDLFLMLANMPGIQPRNEFEIAERKEEKLLMLGPAHERLQNEFFSPLIDWTYDVMDEAGLIPEAPESLHGQQIAIDYISVLAQAQKSVGITAIERTAAFLGRIASFKPEVLDKWDADQSVDEYADIMGVSPKVIVADEAVAQARADRRQQQQQMQAMQMAQAAAAGAKTLSDTHVGDGENALQRILGGQGR